MDFKKTNADKTNADKNITVNPPVLPRAAIIQDMSGFVRVSLTEAIPVMSSMGIEVCPLPTAILSTHTYQFTDYTLLDMTDEMQKILNHWEKLNLTFDAVYSGYLGSGKQIKLISEFMKKQKENGSVIVVDPVLGDNALSDVKNVYSRRMTELTEGMRSLCAVADVITPNLTEACLLLNKPYSPRPMSDTEITRLLKELKSLGAESVVVTSIMDEAFKVDNASDNTSAADSMCVAIYHNGSYFKISCSYVNRPFHGTGDLFTSVLTGGILEGYDLVTAANIAVDFVSAAIKHTVKYSDMPTRHGVLFEPILKEGYFSEGKLNRLLSNDEFKNHVTVLE